MTAGAIVAPNTGAVLKQARMELYLSQERLAEMAGVAVGTIKNAEAGKPLALATRSLLIQAINQERSRCKPPREPLRLSFEDSISVTEEKIRAEGDADSTRAEPLDGNPCAVAIREALRHCAPKDGMERLRLGRIRSPAELMELWNIDSAAYGDSSITYEQFGEWWQCYPNGLLVLFFDNRIIGAMGIWPVSERWASQLQAGRLREKDLHGPVMRRYMKQPARFWYISGIVLARDLIGGRAIKVLLAKGIGCWLRESKIEYPCRMLALASSDQGCSLMKGFGFFPIQMASAMPDKLPLLGLDIDSRTELVTRLQDRDLIVE